LLDKPTFEVGLYKPERHDPQGAHARDELYVIARGSGDFACDGKTEKFQAGDAFFVPAGTAHRFMSFSADFSTWVIFFGPRPSN
jgi:mannose-6-phosphate isomerase-like protein (cupin superfamily)